MRVLSPVETIPEKLKRKQVGVGLISYVLDESPRSFALGSLLMLSYTNLFFTWGRKEERITWDEVM